MMIAEPRTLTYDQISVGDTAAFRHTIENEDMELFARLSGDTNPLHCDETYAKGTKYRGRIVHGMLASSLFSQLVGMHLPGKYCLYISQDLQFRNAIYPGTEVLVRGEVISKSDAFKLLNLETTISDPETNRIFVSGKARVSVLK